MAATTEERVAARATVRYLRVSPYKIRQVLELVRGLPVEDAERVLQLCEKDAADHVLKLLSSATANAEHNLSIEPEELYVARAWADEGPTRKWGQPRARGRYFRIRRRTSHVTIVLERFADEELEERRRREEASGRGAAAVQRRRAERVRRSRKATESRAGGEAGPAEEAAEADTAEAVDAVEAEAAGATETTAEGAAEAAGAADGGEAQAGEIEPDAGDTEPDGEEK
jgi:large subunit ribosomal protein L22